MFKKGDIVRLVDLDENVNPTWREYINHPAVVTQLPMTGPRPGCIRIRFADGEWFPAMPHEIEKISG